MYVQHKQYPSSEYCGSEGNQTQISFFCPVLQGQSDSPHDSATSEQEEIHSARAQSPVGIRISTSAVLGFDFS
jgi:hypothetical protein